MLMWGCIWMGWVGIVSRLQRRRAQKRTRNQLLNVWNRTLIVGRLTTDIVMRFSRTEWCECRVIDFVTSAIQTDVILSVFGVEGCIIVSSGSGPLALVEQVDWEDRKDPHSHECSAWYTAHELNHESYMDYTRLYSPTY